MRSDSIAQWGCNEGVEKCSDPNESVFLWEQVNWNVAETFVMCN